MSSILEIIVNKKAPILLASELSEMLPRLRNNKSSTTVSVSRQLDSADLAAAFDSEHHVNLAIAMIAAFQDRCSTVHS